MYFPNDSPQSGDQELIIAIWEELNKLSNVLNNFETDQVRYKVLHVAPTKPVTGVVIYADGSDFNPGGTGEGLYVYDSGGTWNKL